VANHAAHERPINEIVNVLNCAKFDLQNRIFDSALAAVRPAASAIPQRRLRGRRPPPRHRSTAPNLWNCRF
jgi:hypothetical protein